MAEDLSIFGGATAQPSPGQVRHQRLRDLQLEEAQKRQAIESGYGSPKNDPMSTFRRLRNAAKSKQNIRKGMEGTSPAEQQAAVAEATKQRVAQDPSMRSMPEAQKREYVIKVASEEASRLGMPVVSAKLAQKYADAVKVRRTGELEMSKLESSTVKAHSDSIGSLTEDRTEVNPETGHEETYKVYKDNQDEVKDSRYVSKTGEWKSLPDGSIVSPAGVRKEKPVDWEGNVRDYLKVHNAAQNTITAGGRSIAKVERALRTTAEKHWKVAGLAGKKLGEWGAIPALNEGAVGLKADIASIKAELGLGTIKQLKAASATGSTGLGAVSNIELEMLQQSVEALDQALSPADLALRLASVKDHWGRVQAQIEGSLKLEEIPWHKAEYEQFQYHDSSNPNTTYISLDGGRTAVYKIDR